MKILNFSFLALAIVVGISAAVYFGVSANKPLAELETDRPVKARKTIGVKPIAQIGKRKADKKALSGERVRKSGQPARFEDSFDDPNHPYSPEDKIVARELQEQLDAYEEVASIIAKLNGLDLSDHRVVAKLTPQEREAVEARKRFMSAVKKACESSNPSLRKRGVAALSWEGGEALAELTPMMADLNDEVAEMAIDAAEQALEEQENPNLRFKTAAAYMSTFSANEDALTMLSGTLTSAALEIIEPEGDGVAAAQKALENRNLVVQTLAEMIEGGNPKNSEAAREAFSDITGENWVSRDEASKWAADPENYEAPEL